MRFLNLKVMLGRDLVTAQILLYLSHTGMFLSL